MFTAALSIAARKWEQPKHPSADKWVNKAWPIHTMEWVKVAQLCPTWIYSPRNSPGRNTAVGSLSLLQGIFPIQGLNPGLPHCRRILYQLSHQEALVEWNGILFQWNTIQSLKEWSTDTCYSVDEHWKDDTKWKMADKNATNYKTPFTRNREIQTRQVHRNTKETGGCQGCGVRVLRGGYQWARGFFPSEKVLDWRAGMVAELCKYTKKHWVVYRKEWIITLPLR